jgi:hypothetical protein
MILKIRSGFLDNENKFLKKNLISKLNFNIEY